jgi:hypothetical protein
MASENLTVEWQRIFTNEMEKDALKKSNPNIEKSNPNIEKSNIS